MALDPAEQRSAADAAPWLEQMEIGCAIANAAGELVYVNRTLREWIPPTELPVPLAELASRWRLRSPAGDPFIAEDVPPLRALRDAEPSNAEVVLQRATPEGEQTFVLLWEAWPTCAESPSRPPGSPAPRPTGSGSVLIDFRAYERHRARISALLDQARRELVTLSTPVLTIGERILLQPLIGSLAGTRGAFALEELLAGIGRARARVAIVDVTGVPEIDRNTATQLIKALSAAALLGCEVILTGIRPAVARSMTLAGVDLASVRVARDVASALEIAHVGSAQRARAAGSLAP